MISGLNQSWIKTQLYHLQMNLARLFNVSVSSNDNS